MKRFIIIAAIVLLLFGAIRAFLNTKNAVDDEMRYYVQNLHYNFSARVDSIEILNAKRQRGFLVCDLIKGKCNGSVEDSLNHHLVNYKRIRFLFFYPNGQFKILRDGIFKYQSGDRVAVNSDRDEFKIFRDGDVIWKSKITQSTIHKVSFAFWIRD